jgi:hypothetical protein
MRNANPFGLCAINLIAENPAAARAVRVHAAPAIFTPPACGDARDKNAVASAKSRDAWPGFVDNASPFVAQDPSGTACWNIALQDVEVGAAYRRLGNPHDGIAWVSYVRNGPVFDDFLAGAFVNQCFHCASHFHAIAVIPPSTIYDHCSPAL